MKSYIETMLTLIIGPMFSGKTNMLIDIIRAYDVCDACIIKHSMDDRYSTTAIKSHDGKIVDATHVVSELKLVNPIAANIFIDEGFMFPDLAQFCKKWIKHKNIYVSTPSSNYLMEPWPVERSVTHLATYIHCLTSQCYIDGCTAPAAFTVKKCCGTNMIEIGGANMYAPSCYAHHTCPQSICL